MASISNDSASREEFEGIQIKRQNGRGCPEANGISQAHLCIRDPWITLWMVLLPSHSTADTSFSLLWRILRSRISFSQFDHINCDPFDS